MKRIAAAVIGAALVAVTATSAQAQKGNLFLVLEGGASLPMGDFKDGGAKTGWIGNGGLGYNVTNHLFLAAVYRMGANGNDLLADEKLKLSGFEGSLGYSFGSATAKMAPYVRGGFGQLKGKVGDVSGDGQTSMSGAVGLFMPKGKGGWFLEGQYNTVKTPVDGVKQNFLALSLGFTWSLHMSK